MKGLQAGAAASVAGASTAVPPAPPSIDPASSVSTGPPTVAAPQPIASWQAMASAVWATSRRFDIAPSATWLLHERPAVELAVVLRVAEQVRDPCRCLARRDVVRHQRV